STVTGAKCEPTIAANYTKQWTAPTQPAASAPCATADITSYYDQCLATLGQDAGASACNTWKAGHDSCGKCIEPTSNAGPIQWYESRYYYTINVAGCVAIKQDKYGADDCGGAYGAAVNCERDACEGCFKTGTSTFNDFRNCENAASKVGLCKSLESDQSTKCT